MRDLRERLQAEVGKVVIGQEHVTEALLLATVVGGHVLLEGVPGVAKTLLADTFARSLGVDFVRVQFTPDMLPSDLTGTMTLRQGELVFRQGPIFSNVVLADEINRTPPKTQAALLEAMQERKVTIDGDSRPLPDPFLVVATQNPIEYEGTYPLPEAQLDRFLFKVDVGYPSEESERAMLHLGRDGLIPAGIANVGTAISTEEIARARSAVEAVTVSDEVAGYVTAVVRQTRSLPSVEVGASPRAAVHLLAAAKASARVHDRDFVTPDDVRRVGAIVLAHRLVLRAEAELERYSPADAIASTFQTVPVPR